MNTDTMYMFAYGMNTNLTSMADRCPKSQSLGHAFVRGYRFRFAGPADIVQDPGEITHGVLWRITPECLVSLDRLEGYPHFYQRKILNVERRGRVYQALAYYMTPGYHDLLPSRTYWDCVATGYQEHGIPCSQMTRAFHRVLGTVSRTVAREHVVV